MWDGSASSSFNLSLFPWERRGGDLAKPHLAIPKQAGLTGTKVLGTTYYSSTIKKGGGEEVKKRP